MHGGLRRPPYNAWRDYVAGINGAAPAGASSGVLQTAKQDWEAYWLKMVILELLFSYVFLVISASTVVSFFVVLIATRSLRGAIISVLAIGCVLCNLFGVMVGVYKLTLGFLESIIMMIAVGLMLDPFTHYVHAFSHERGGRPQRLKTMLSSMGISVLAATLSTAGACSALFGTVIVLFSRFGMLLCALMVIALVYANLFLAPMLFLFGPSSPARTADADRRATRTGPEEKGTELTSPARSAI